MHPFNRYGCHGVIVITCHAAKTHWLYITHTHTNKHKTKQNTHAQSKTETHPQTTRNMYRDVFLIIDWSKKASVGADTIIFCVSNRKTGTIFTCNVNQILTLLWFELVLHVMWVGRTCPIYLPGTCESTWTDLFFFLNSSYVLKCWNIKW